MTFSPLSSLIDVVLLANGSGKSLHPMTSVTCKALVPLCNRPLIWYAVSAWINAGASHFYVCVSEKNHEAIHTTLKTATEFGSQVTFGFVIVRESEYQTTSMAALSAFHTYKMENRQPKRPTVFHSCNVVMAGTDLLLPHFVQNFFTERHTVLSLLYQSSNDDEGGVHVGLEGVGDHYFTTPKPSAFRMHYLCRSDFLEGAGELSLSAGALARRPDLLFASHLCYGHVVLMRPDIIEFASTRFSSELGSDEGPELLSIGSDLLPMLAVAQLTAVNTKHQHMLRPWQRLGREKPFPKHWLDDARDYPVRAFNLTDSKSQPAVWDELRVFSYVVPVQFNNQINSKTQSTVRIARITSLESLHALTNEVLAARQSQTHPLVQLLRPFVDYEHAALLASHDDDQDVRRRIDNCITLSLPEPKSSLRTCVLGRYVYVGEGAILRGCILHESSTVAPGVKLNNVILLPGAHATVSTKNALVEAMGDIDRVA